MKYFIVTCIAICISFYTKAQDLAGCLNENQLIRMQKTSLEDIKLFLNNEGWDMGSVFKEEALKYNFVGWFKSYYDNGGEITLYFQQGNSNIIRFKATYSCFQQLKTNQAKKYIGKTSILNNILITSFNNNGIAVEFCEYKNSDSKSRYLIVLYNTIGFSKEIKEYIIISAYDGIHFEDISHESDNNQVTNSYPPPPPPSHDEKNNQSDNNSTSSFDVPTGVLTINIDDDGKVSMSIEGRANRINLLKMMADQYNLTFSSNELKEFSLVQSFGVPVEKLKAYLNPYSSEKSSYLTGIPIDSDDNQLNLWIRFAFLAQPNTEIILKTDNGTPNMVIEKVTGTIVKLNNYNLKTDLGEEQRFVKNKTYVDEVKEILEVTEVQEESKPVYTVVEEMPQYPGGETERNKFLAINIVYPQQATENGIQGTVYVSFIVDLKGNITDVKVLRGIGGGCDEEALRVVKMMPLWNPGKQNGKLVRVLYNMPIYFKLQG
jgi:TonB family protein